MPQPIDVVEALLFASDSPLEAERIREVLELADAGEARALIDALRERYVAADGALTVVEVAGGFRMVTRPEIAPWLLRLARTRTKARLSRAALETLAIVGYRQPVSRPEVDALRGVNSDAVLDNLLERRLIRIAGRKEAPGRPFLYETTREFLIAFGLRDVGDLPKVEGELVVPEGHEAVAEGHEAVAAGLETAAAGHETEIAVEAPVDDAPDGTPEAPPEAAPEEPEAAPETPEIPEAAPEGSQTGPEVAVDSAVDSVDAHAQAEQDPRPGGTDVAPGR